MFYLERESNEPAHDKTYKWHVRPAKTQISLGIRPVWSVLAGSVNSVLNVLSTNLIALNWCNVSNSMWNYSFLLFSLLLPIFWYDLNF